MTTIVAVSDTHTFHRQVPVIPCDILVFAGDYEMFNKGRGKLWQDFSDWLANYPAKDIIFVPGNHDVYFMENQNSLSLSLPLKVHTLVDEAKTVQGIKFYGSPWTPYFHGWAYNAPEKGGEEFLEQIWGMVPDDTEILVTHGPPKTILDTWAKTQHIGDQQLLDRVFNIPALQHHIFGHVHAGYGQMVRKGVTFSNVAFVDEDRDPVNQPIIIEI